MPLVNQAATDDDDDNNDDDETYFMEQAQHFVQEMMDDVSSCHDDGGRSLGKECLSKQHHMIHDSVGKSKLPAHDFSLHTEEEMNQNPTFSNWRSRKKEEANERFMDAVTEALNGVVVVSHGDLFSDTRVAQLLALAFWIYAGGILCQQFVITMAKEWL